MSESPVPARVEDAAPGGKGDHVSTAHDNAGLTPPPTPVADPPDDPTLDLKRIAWSLTTLGFAIAVVVLALRGDIGYAAVTLAVALAAAINLF